MANRITLSCLTFAVNMVMIIICFIWFISFHHSGSSYENEIIREDQGQPVGKDESGTELRHIPENQGVAAVDPTSVIQPRHIRDYLRTMYNPSHRETLEQLQGIEDYSKMVPLISSLMIHPLKEGNIAKTSLKAEPTPLTKEVRDILKDKEGGFFVEVGGFDGETASNTLDLEKSLKWRGLLIEMDPMYYMQLVGKNRNIYSIQACLATTNQVKEVTISTRGQSSQPETRKWRLRKNNPDAHFAPCFPLGAILQTIDVTHIDYLSLDVEGLELEVLKTIPWNKLNIDVLSVEYNHIPNREALVPFMEKQGYYVHKDVVYSEKSKALWIHDYIFVHKRLSKSDA